jgi:hypothetical protein
MNADRPASRYKPLHDAAPEHIRESARRMRELFEDSVRRMMADCRKPLLMLSGGGDSLMIALALHALGLQADSLTMGFGPGDTDDLKRARFTAAELFPDAAHHELRREQDFAEFERHLREAILFLGSASEALLEVTWLTFEGVRFAAANGYREVIFGFDASAHWGCDRQMIKIKAVSHQEWMDERAASVYTELVNFPLGSERATREYARKFRLRQLDPFSDFALRDFTFRQPFDVMNYELPKGLLRVAYPEAIKYRPLVMNMQSGCDVQKWCERVIAERYGCSPVRYYHDLALSLDVEWSGEFGHYDKFRLRRDEAAVAQAQSLIGRLRSDGVIRYEWLSPEEAARKQQPLTRKE